MGRWARSGIAGASIAAFAVAMGAWAALLGIAALGIVEVRRPGAPAPRLGRWALGIGGTISAALALLPLLVTFQRVYLETAVQIAVPVGTLLSMLLAGLLWAAPTLILPGSISLLAAAALGRETLPLYLFAGASGLAAALDLASYRPLRVGPLLVFLALASSIAVGVMRFLPWAQPWVEAKAGELLSPTQTARAGLSLTSRLGEVEELGLSPEVALRVWSDRPQYLRGRVYRSFNGRLWSRGVEAERKILSAAPEQGADLSRWLREVPGTTWAAPSPSAAGPQVRSRILLERRPPAGALPAPAGVELVRLEGKPVMMDGSGILEQPGGPAELYAVVNRASMPAPPPEGDWLDASGTTDARMKELAARLGKDADPALRIRRTLAYLESTCTYSLQVGPFRSKDPVAEFVFDKRKGYCEYFASAAALLLRMEGVPARYVVGYCVRPENFEGGHYVVREADAHAWIEAWLEGRGWVEWDPTPAAQFGSLRKKLRSGAVGGLWERLKAWFGLIGAGASGPWSRTLGVVLAGGIAAGVVGVLIVRRRRRRSGPRSPREALPADPVPAELGDLMDRLDRAWKRSGHPRPPSRAPLEHWLGLPEPARLGRDLVETIYRCRYGGQVPSPEELAILRRARFH